MRDDNETPETDDPPRGRRAARAAAVSRKDRLALRRRTVQARPGGVIAGCGCRYARIAGQWLHLTPCHVHMLRTWALADEDMRAVA